LKEVTAPLISDAAGKRYGLPGIRHITGPTPVVGRALTVKVEGKDWGIVVEAMDEAEEGDVLVIKPEDGIRAFWGGLSSLSAVEKGLAGTVVDGLVRDVEDIEELNYPVFARGTTCQAGSHASKGEIGADVYIGGVLVRTGDVISGMENPGGRSYGRSDPGVRPAWSRTYGRTWSLVPTRRTSCTP